MASYRNDKGRKDGMARDRGKDMERDDDDELPEDDLEEDEDDEDEDGSGEPEAVAPGRMRKALSAPMSEAEILKALGADTLITDLDPIAQAVEEAVDAAVSPFFEEQTQLLKAVSLGVARIVKALRVQSAENATLREEVTTLRKALKPLQESTQLLKGLQTAYDTNAGRSAETRAAQTGTIDEVVNNQVLQPGAAIPSPVQNGNQDGPALLNDVQRQELGQLMQKAIEIRNETKKPVPFYGETLSALQEGTAHEGHLVALRKSVKTMEGLIAA